MWKKRKIQFDEYQEGREICDRMKSSQEGGRNLIRRSKWKKQNIFIRILFTILSRWWLKVDSV